MPKSFLVTVEAAADTWEADSWTIARHLEDAGIEPVDYVTYSDGIPVPRFDAWDIVSIINEHRIVPLERVIKIDHDYV